MAESNGAGAARIAQLWPIGAGAGGLLVAAFSLVDSHISSITSQVDIVANDAATALKVVAQHGDEFNAVRSDVVQLHQRIAEVQAQVNLGGRFTREDGDRLRQRVERLGDRVDRLAEEHARFNTLRDD